MLVLIGTHSKDGKVSIFIENRHLYSTNGSNWNLLEGYLTTTTDLTPVVQVECAFHFKSGIGITHEKVLFSQIQQPISVADQTRKFHFSFDFGRKSLPPSFLFDPLEWKNDKLFGVVWTLRGIVGDIVGPVIRKDNVKVVSSTKCLFHVGYRYSQDLVGLEPTISESTTTNQYQRFPAIFSKNSIKLTAKIINPIIVQPKRQLLINLLLEGISERHSINNINVVIKQKITLQLLNSQKFKFKKTALRFNQKPAPSYYRNSEGKQTYDLMLDDDFMSSTSKFAKSYPLDWKLGDDPADDLVPSTIFQQHASGSTGVSVEYVVKVTTSILEPSGKSVELSISMPLIVGASEPREDPDLLTRDAFMPILSSLIEDIRLSIQGLETMLIEWKSYRHDSAQRETMCTESSDHAKFLLDIVDSFDEQLLLFKEHVLKGTNIVKIPWKPGMPFNMFILELELLIRACPQERNGSYHLASTSHEPIVKLLLESSMRFFKLAETLVMAWIHPFAQEPVAFVQSLEKEYHHVCVLLERIAEGEDFETGVEKPDSDLIEALRLSALCSSTSV